MLLNPAKTAIQVAAEYYEHRSRYVKTAAGESSSAEGEGNEHPVQLDRWGSPVKPMTTQEQNRVHCNECKPLRPAEEGAGPTINDIYDGQMNELRAIKVSITQHEATICSHNIVQFDTTKHHKTA